MLSDFQIVTQRAHGNIVIEPFNHKQLGTNSYDCRLGEHYYSMETQGEDLYLFSEGLREAWGKPKKAQDGWIPVRSGETILAHTLEVIGGRNGYVASLRTRSTVARSCLDVCGSAGLGDCGFIDSWALEIRNMSPHTIWIPTGGRIGQFEFHYLAETLKHYDGNYGQGVWEPQSMLPSAKPDWAVEEYQQSLADGQVL